MSANERPARLSIEVPRETRRRLHIAAARRDQSVRRYVSDAVEARLKQDLGDLKPDDLLVLRERTDSVLAALWGNARDAAYDKL